MSWIEGPAEDLLLFVFSPLLSGALPGLLMIVAPDLSIFSLPGLWGPIVIGLLGILSQGHVFIGAYRAYGNPEVFSRFSTRLIWVPLILLAAVTVSIEFVIVAALIQFFWTFYHYARQHVGFCHIYDRKIGRFSKQDRAWDEAFVWMVYLVPQFFFVVNLNGMLGGLRRFNPQPATLGRWAQVGPEWIARERGWALLLCSMFVLIYFARAFLQCRAREELSWQKHAFLASLAAAVLGGWAIFHEGYVFESMVVLHSLQYYGIVAFTEKESFRRWAIPRIRPAFVSGLAMLATGIVCGWYAANAAAAEKAHGLQELGFRFVFGSVSIANLVHFWSDGFIWSRAKVTVDTS